jgi:hypothetical protein
MTDDNDDILSTVAADLTDVADSLSRLAPKMIGGRDTAQLMDLSQKVGNACKLALKASGWNGKGFDGSGDRVSATYDVADLQAISKTIIEAVGDRPSADIAHVMPTILEIVFPQLAKKFG